MDLEDKNIDWVEAARSPKDETEMAEWLIEMLEEEDDESWRVVQRNALCSIGKPALEPLVKALSHEKDQVRYSVAWVLGYIGDVTAIAPLSQGLDDTEEWICATVARALIKIGGNQVINIMQKILEDKNTSAKKAMYVEKILHELRQR